MERRTFIQNLSSLLVASQIEVPLSLAKDTPKIEVLQGDELVVFDIEKCNLEIQQETIDVTRFDSPFTEIIPMLKTWKLCAEMNGDQQKKLFKMCTNGVAVDLRFGTRFHKYQGKAIITDVYLSRKVFKADFLGSGKLINMYNE